MKEEKIINYTYDMDKKIAECWFGDLHIDEGNSIMHIKCQVYRCESYSKYELIKSLIFSHNKNLFANLYFDISSEKGIILESKYKERISLDKIIP